MILELIDQEITSLKFIIPILFDKIKHKIILIYISFKHKKLPIENVF